MLETALGVNYSNNRVLRNTQDAIYWTGGMLETTHDGIYSDRWMMGIPKDANSSADGGAENHSGC